jgi:FtsZ-interacting cell division protein ZipA
VFICVCVWGRRVINDFTLALIGAAAAVIAAILAFNWWTERRHARTAERAFKADHPDVLFDAEDATKPARVEPTLGELPVPEDDFVFPAPEAVQSLAPRQHEPERGINARIDSIAVILAEAPVATDTLTGFVLSSQKLGRAVHWEALVNGVWEPLDVALSNGAPALKEIRVGMQLADRNGPTPKATISEFMILAEELAHEVSAVSQREDMDEAFERAQKVDAFCADTDIEIAISLIGRSGVTFAPTKVRGLLEAGGLTALPTGEYSQPDEEGRALFTVRNMEPTEPPAINKSGYLTGLSLALDVPHCANGMLALERMLMLARQLSEALGGDVVDDNRRPLNANGIEAIRQAIRGIAAQMDHFGVAPGSASAKRLYR